MPAPSAPTPGLPTWVDLGCDDVDAAAAFYREVVGFEAEPGDPRFGGYANAHVDGRRVCALTPKMDPSQPTAWTTYLHAEDIGHSAAGVREAGGTVLVEPMAVGAFGAFAIAQDPTGAVFGLWEPGTHTGAELVGEPGSWAWAHCHTPDPERAGAFYADVFGVAVAPLAVGEVTMLALMAGDRPVAGISTPQGGHGAWWSTDFAVRDCDAAVAKALDLGAEVVVPPFDFPFGRNAVIRDPQGASVGLFEPAAT